jgi:anti-sigma regulatory factor (Ser/Thr protein kinase)
MTALTFDAAPAYALEIRNADANTPHRARHWLAWLLEIGRVTQDVIDAAVLAASELVTNAAVHAGGRVLVSAQVTEDGVRLVVHDDAPATDWLEPEQGLAEDGRGLVIVRALAAELDITTGHDGTTVEALIPNPKEAAR